MQRKGKQNKTFSIVVRFSKCHRFPLKKGHATHTHAHSHRVNQAVARGSTRGGKGCHQMCPGMEDDKEKIVHYHRTEDSRSACLLWFNPVASSPKSTLLLTFTVLGLPRMWKSCFEDAHFQKELKKKTKKTPLKLMYKCVS